MIQIIMDEYPFCDLIFISEDESNQIWLQINSCTRILFRNIENQFKNNRFYEPITLIVRNFAF